MNRSVRLFACLAVAVPLIVSAGGPGEGVREVKQRGQRGDLVYRIVMKWAPHVREAFGGDVLRWTREMGPVFAGASIDALSKAATARTFESMNDALLATSTNSVQTAIQPMALGAADRDLVLVPVEPCRIIDTRVAGGAIAGDSTRNFDVTAVSNYAFQGGSADNCNGVGAAGSFAAAVINFTVVSPNGGGYITAFPYATTRPLASTVNYSAGDVRANLAVVKLDQGASANELSVYTAAQTHLVADIVGYFTQATSPAAALDCMTTAQTVVSVDPGGTKNAVAPACPAGYSATGQNCEAGSWLMPFVYQSGGTCSARNNGASAADLRASRTCCRVPAI